MDLPEKSKDGTEHGSCPGCGHPENPPGNLFCGRCGASLERSPARRSGELALRAEESKVKLRERLLPGGLGPVGRTVAVGLAVVAADVGLAWLRHRLEKTGRSTLPHEARQAWREVPGKGSGYLHGYSLEEAALLLKDGRGTHWSYSSRLEIKSSRIEK